MNDNMHPEDAAALEEMQQTKFEDARQTGNVQETVDRMFLFAYGFGSVGIEPSLFEHHLIRCFMLANSTNLYTLTKAYPIFGRAFADLNSGKLELKYGVE